jgi:NAD(P)-dependent dehydrogenase (short-subunit alcohol dehydrogenase family)
MAAERLADPDQVRWLTGRVPLGRVGEAEDSAALAYFLLSNDASWVTGQIIGVDGGRSAVA